ACFIRYDCRIVSGAEVLVILLNVNEAAIVEVRGHFVARGALIENDKILERAIVPVGRNHVAVGATWRNAKPVDAACQVWFHLKNGGPQRLALDEVVRDLIKGPVEIIVNASVALENADQDFAVDLVVAVEGEPSPFTYQNPFVSLGRGEVLGDTSGFVQDVVEGFQLLVEDQEEQIGRASCRGRV